MHDILQLDIQGTPQDWISAQEAASLLYAGHIAWSAGPAVRTLYGGVQRVSGLRSSVEVPAIVATRGHPKTNLADHVPSLGRSNVKLFARDRNICAYCGDRHGTSGLTRDHIMPVSRGGEDSWMNVVTACYRCNQEKGAKTPEQYGRQLIYLPYTPNWFEDIILRRGGRRILADQMGFLEGRLPAHSRLRN